jgi:hypothetical protein
MAERRIDKYNETYNNFIVIWDKWIKQADNDMRFSLGDQWSSSEKGYLKNKRRNAFVFNKIKRVIKIISGYQRKNRLSYKVDPNENSDTQDASIWSQTLQYVMRHSRGYNVMSEAFEQGTLKTGLNLVEPWLDFSTDPLNGELKYTRIPHNRFLLHPSFTRRDLSDCPEILRREWITRSAAKSILPFFAGQIDKLKPETRPAQDNKYITSNFNENLLHQDLLRYDEHWVRVSKPITVFFDTTNGRMFKFTGKDKDAREVKRQFPFLEIIKRFERDVEVTIFLEDEEVYHGPDPLGTKDYRFVPVMGYFDSEFIELDKKLQGIIRDIIDPQREINKRRSKNMDILDSQLNTGYIAEEKAVVNKESLYQTGQGGVIWLKQQSGRSIEERLKKIVPPDIPPGNLEMQKTMDNDLIEISGANNELLGLADKDDVEVAGILAKIRTGQALTTLQDLFDNYGISKELLGRNSMSIIRNNWDAAKIFKITNRQPSPRFFDPDLALYDLEVTEGVLTDSQKQMNHMQLIGMKRAGINIPDAAIIQSSNLENKDELAKIVQGQAEAAKQSQQIQNQVNQAAIKSTNAKAVKDMTAAEVNSSKADLNKILGIKAASEIENDKLTTAVAVAKDIDEIVNSEPKQLVTQR